MISTAVSNPDNKPESSEENDIQKLLTQIKKRSPTSKILVGSTFGWITGLLVARIGKLVAFSLGGAIILLQMAKERSLWKINWTQVDDRVRKVPSSLKKDTLERCRKKIEAAVNYDTILSSGFIGGFFIGLSTD